jgi:hypothetical protein
MFAARLVATDLSFLLTFVKSLEGVNSDEIFAHAGTVTYIAPGVALDSASFDRALVPPAEQVPNE